MQSIGAKSPRYIDAAGISYTLAASDLNPGPLDQESEALPGHYLIKAKKKVKSE